MLRLAIALVLLSALPAQAQTPKPDLPGVNSSQFVTVCHSLDHINEVVGLIKQNRQADAAKLLRQLQRTDNPTGNSHCMRLPFHAVVEQATSFTLLDQYPNLTAHDGSVLSVMTLKLSYGDHEPVYMLVTRAGGGRDT